MKLQVCLLLFLVAGLVGIACGEAATSTPTRTPIPTTDATLTPTPTAIATQSPTATPTPTLAPIPTSENPGTLEIRVTARPSDGLTSILVTVSSIEVNVSEDSVEAGWRTVIAEPQQFDLVNVQGIEKVLGSAVLEPGRYQQLRLEVTEAVLTVRGNKRRADIASPKFQLVGGFDVTTGATTVLTLGFDAERSIVFQPGVGPQLDPVVKLLVRKGGQSLAEASEVAAESEETTTPETPTTPEAGLTAVRVVVPTPDNLQFMSFWIALGAGFFSDEGFGIQKVVPPNPLGTGQFLLQGRADIAVMPPPMYLPLIGQEEPILVFANLLQNDSINLVVRKEVAEQRQLSIDAPLADRLNAMLGLRIGVAPGPPTRLRVLFESVGLDADSDIEMVIIHGGEQNQAFADGTIDALYAHTPYLETALVEQEAVLIVNQSAGEVPELTGRQIHSLVTTQPYASANPEILEALARALYRAQQLIHTDLQDAADAILAAGVQGLEPQRLETIIAIYEPAIPDAPEVSIEGVLRQLELYPAHQTPPDLSGIDMTTYVDPQFAERAVASSP